MGVGTGWSDDAAGEVVDDLVIEPDAWVDSAEASA